ncbi:hypothetical protein P9112_005796 [Eukaryota sp. TZLM1-RC]
MGSSHSSRIHNFDPSQVPPGFQLYYSDYGPVLIPSQQLQLVSTFPTIWNSHCDVNVEYHDGSGNYPNQKNVDDGLEVTYVNESDLDCPDIVDGGPASYSPTTNDDTGDKDKKLSKLGISSSLRSIRRHHGIGISLYFSFIKFLYFYCLYFVLSGLLVLIPSLLQYNTSNFPDLNFRGIYAEILEHTTSYEGIATLPLLFSSARYYGEIRWIFLLSIVTNAALTFALPFRYLVHHEITLSKYEKEDRNTCQGSLLSRSRSVKNTSFDVITDNKNIHWLIRSVRLFVGFILWLLTLVISSIVNWITISRLADAPLGQILVSSYVVCSNYMWKKLAKKIVDFEKHKTWTGKYAARLFHVYVLKLAQVCVLYLSRFLVWADKRQENSFRVDGCLCYESNITGTGCGFDSMASQIFWLLVTDIVLVNIVQWLWPLFKKFVLKRDEKSEFDTSDEYVEVIYRMFLLSVGSSFFPLLGILVFIGQFLEYYHDKISLLKLFKLEFAFGNMKNTIFYLLLANAIVSVLIFPSGILWFLFGTTDSYFGYFQDCEVMKLADCTIICKNL